MIRRTIGQRVAAELELQERDKHEADRYRAGYRQGLRVAYLFIAEGVSVARERQRLFRQLRTIHDAECGSMLLLLEGPGMRAMVARRLRKWRAK